MNTNSERRILYGLSGKIIRAALSTRIFYPFAARIVYGPKKEREQRARAQIAALFMERGKKQ